MAEESTATAEAATTQQEPPAPAEAAKQPAEAEQSTKDKESATPADTEPKKATAAPTTSSNTPSANIEFEPPAACIRRLLKASLPKSTNISKDSVAAISRASGIFVLYLTACANDVAREGKRSTIVAKDVLGALSELDFGEYVPIMEKFLEGHRKEEKNKKEEKERLKKQAGEEVKVKDSTTGQFVAKVVENDDGGGEAKKNEDGEGNDADEAKGGDGNNMEEDKQTSEKEADTAKEPIATETKHARDDDEGAENNDADEKEEPLAKKQKIDEGGD